MGLLIHVVAFAAVNAVLLLVWAVGGDGDRSITDALADPVAAARRDGFWPIWVLAGWGGLVAIHAAVALQVRRVRRRRRRRERRRAARQVGADVVAALGHPSPPVPAPKPQPTPTGRHWVVALFTDVVGSTELAEALGDDEWSTVMTEHRRVVRTAVTEHGGTEVGTQGDGFLLRFDHPADAVRCAVALQQGFDDERATGRLTPQVRMGIHAGEALGADDGDLIGRALNVASRVTSLAAASEILVTEAVADRLEHDVALEDRGLQELRGTGHPRHVLAVRWRGEPLPLADDVLGTPIVDPLHDR